jgi:2-methylcitrate dehydratase PrpD
VGVPDSTRTGRWGFAEVFGAGWADPDPSAPAIADNWIKRYPCCLQTHGAIEAAVTGVQQGAAAGGRGTVTVHSISRQAAPLDAEVETGLEAKFSIPYCTALAVFRGHPSLSDFSVVDPLVRSLAGRIEVRTDDSLLESEARLGWTNPDGDATDLAKLIS